jgi:hypothetical protein
METSLMSGPATFLSTTDPKAILDGASFFCRPKNGSEKHFFEHLGCARRLLPGSDGTMGWQNTQISVSRFKN